MTISRELPPAWAATFATAGIDLDTVRKRPDGMIEVDLPRGGVVFAGDKDGWLSATAYDPDDSELTLYGGRDLAALTAAVAALVVR